MSDMDLGRTWLSDCLSNHPRCSRRQTAELPTRLLDLGAFPDSADIKLVPSNSLPSPKAAEYFALSHCWGGDVPLKTTHAEGRFKSYLERIPYDKLPLSFREAVNVTRELRCRYLWIDSFCIIQDDKGDWEREARRMADVYGGSALTLCASSAENSMQGCHVGAMRTAGRYNSPPSARYLDFDSGQGVFRVFTKQPEPWNLHDRFENPLRRRAWTLQEQELSTRMLHFASDVLLWQCASLSATGQLPWHNIAPWSQVKRTPLKNSTGEETVTPNEDAEARERWYRTIEEYTLRELTVENDKLPALAGLATRFQLQVPNSTYLAGNWSEHLPSALLWRALPTARSGLGPKRPGKPRAPTWSWASLDGAVSYGSQGLRTSQAQQANTQQQQEPGLEDDDMWLSKVISAECATKISEQWSTAPEGRVMLAGPLVRMRIVPRIPDGHGEVRRMLRLSREEWDYVSLVIDHAEKIVGLFFQDVHKGGMSTEDRVLYCLGIRNEMHNSSSPPPSPSLPARPDPRHFQVYQSWNRPKGATWPMANSDEQSVMGLGLTETEVEHVYQRSGLIRWLKKSVFEGVASSTVTLV